MRVIVNVEEDEIEGDYGSAPGIRVTCGRCGLEVEVLGQGEASVRRGCVMLREECPRAERNFYVSRD